MAIHFRNGVNFEVLCYFGSLRGPRPSRYPNPGAQTNACATLVKIDLIDMSMDEHNFLVNSGNSFKKCEKF